MDDFPAPGFYPFWFWNGEMEPDEIRWQIAQMAEQGVRGFYIHSRQGLRVPYLSAAFLDRVRMAIAAAQEHGMQAELYDEFPYPSGVAGGQVTLGRPEFQGTRLRHVDVELAGHRGQHTLTEGHVLSAQVYPIADDGSTRWDAGRDVRQEIGMVFSRGSYVETGLTRYNNKRFFEQDPLPTLAYDLPEGRWRLVAAMQVRVDDHKYWNSFLDVYNPEAVAEFLRLTHGRYAAEIGDAIGTTTRSIFIDETAPGWSPRLLDRYREQTGEDLTALLPAFLCADHPEHLAARVTVQDLQYAAFCEVFETAYRDACHEAGLLYAGEKPAWRLSQLRYMDIPGCDPGHTKSGDWPDCFKAKARSNARAVASAAYFYDKRASMDECYHSLGWTATLQDAKLIADILLLAGIDMLVPHGFFYSTHALRKHDAPPSFFFQMPYWPFFGELSAHVTRLGEALAGTYIAADVLVIDPTWGLPTPEQSAEYETMTRALLAGHCDFLVVDTDILEAGRIDAARLHVKDIAARAIVLPPMRYVEPPLAAWLERWRAAGGIVLETCDGIRDYAATWNTQHAAPAIVSPQLIADTPTPLSVRRRSHSHQGTTVLLVNPADTAQTVEIDGQPLRLQPFESRILGAQPAQPVVGEIDLADLTCESLELLTPNTLRLNDWQLAIAPATDSDYDQEATVPAVPLANQLEIGHFAIQPRIGGGFGVTPSLHWPQVRLRYRCTVDLAEAIPAAALLMEPESIVGDWSLTVNDAPIAAAAFLPGDVPVRGTLAAPVGQHLRAGANTITLLVTTDRCDGGLVNPLYLAVGDQRITLTPDGPPPHAATTGQPPRVSPAVVPPRIAPAAAPPRFEDYRANGIPHFAGVLRYTLLLPAHLAPGPYHLLHDGRSSLEAMRLRLDDGLWCDSLWEPRILHIPAGARRLHIDLHTALGRHFDALAFSPAHHHVHPAT